MDLNIDLKNIKFKRKQVFKKGSLEVHPTPFWNIVMLVAFVMIVFSFTFTFLVFRKINKELGSTLNGQSVETYILPKERIEKILEYFKEREEKSKEIINNPSPIIDPSL